VLLDSLMPEFDASRIEHRVIDGQPADVCETAVYGEFVDAMRRSRIVRGTGIGALELGDRLRVDAECRTAPRRGWDSGRAQASRVQLNALAPQSNAVRLGSVSSSAP
jgi:hypothetical protein